jgi:hypothetical protein
MILLKQLEINEICGEDLRVIQQENCVLRGLMALNILYFLFRNGFASGELFSSTNILIDKFELLD